MEHTIPFLMTIDESLDIGLDTRSPVDESYTLPFAFTGTIDKLTYNIRPEQLSAADRDEFNHVVAAARDAPAR
jgi:arylsulfatase